MSDDKPKPREEKSPWPRRVAVGFGVIVVLGLVLMIVANIVFKSTVMGKIEQVLAKEGMQSDSGELDCSLLRKEIEINNFSAKPTTAKALERFGNVKLDHGRVNLTTDRKNYIQEIYLEGLSAKLGTVKKVEYIPDKSISIEGLTLNYPDKLGGEPFAEIGEIKLVYADSAGNGGSHFKEVRIDFSQITIVRGPDGKWLTEHSGVAEERVRKMEKITAIDSLTLNIGKISFKDLSTGVPAQVVEVNKEIVVNDPENPRDYPMAILPKILWIARVAKKEFGIE